MQRDRVVQVQHGSVAGAEERGVESGEDGGGGSVLSCWSLRGGERMVGGGWNFVRVTPDRLIGGGDGVEDVLSRALEGETDGLKQQ